MGVWVPGSPRRELMTRAWRTMVLVGGRVGILHALAAGPTQFGLGFVETPFQHFLLQPAHPPVGDESGKRAV